MILKRLAVFIVLIVSACGPDTGTSHDRSPVSLIEAMPGRLQEQARTVLDGSEDERSRAVTNLARKFPAESLDFLLSVLRQEDSPAVRRAIIYHLGRYPDQRVEVALREWAKVEKDTDLALLALERLRGITTFEVQRLLESRIAKAGTNDEDLRKLGQDEERFLYLTRGVILPAWLRTPPPLFSAHPGAAVHVLAFGDYGDGGEDQQRVAGAMLKYHRLHPFDLAVTLGDNFQDHGPEGPADPRWRPRWREPYHPLRLSFYPCLGNHDWASSSGPAAEVLYSDHDPYWKMPATYYTFEAGPVQFFALDTNALSSRQLGWLRDCLRESTAPWRVVYGHHPIFSSGTHGDTQELVERLLPLLRGKVQVYISGHDHHMEHIGPEEGVNFFVAGVGGHSLRTPHPSVRTRFSAAVYGFATIEADKDSLTVEFLDVDLRSLYKHTLTSPAAELVTMAP